ncbi:MAG: hypothetical protein HYR80_07765, partial [Nitrospirae bacterium]|nr:hypothetical protein [Nitrospirota bacterium]
MKSISGPSRTITQEMGGINRDGDVNVDLSVLDGTGFYQSGYSSGAPQGYIPTLQINMGIWGGELRVGGGYGTESSTRTGSLGYKFIAGPGAAYGRINFNRVSPSPNTTPGYPAKTGDFDITAGYAFSKDLKNMIVNLNGEFTIDSDYFDNGTSTNQSTTDLKLNGAILMPVISKLSFICELGFDTSANPTKTANGNSSTALVVGLGGRLTPNSKVTIDGLVLSYASLSGSGRPYDSVSGIGTPVVLRANYQF